MCAINMRCSILYCNATISDIRECDMGLYLCMPDIKFISKMIVEAGFVIVTQLQCPALRPALKV